MDHTVTITLPDDVYQGLRQQVSEEKISQFIEALVRSRVAAESDLEAAYREMAADTAREQEAWEWIEDAPDDALE